MAQSSRAPTAFLLVALVAAAAACAETPKAADAEYRFWAAFLRGPARPGSWKADPKAPPAVARAKQTLRSGLGMLLSRCRWSDGRGRLRIRPVGGTDVSGVLSALYVSGNARFVGLLSKDRTGPFHVRFPRAEHFYEFAQHRYAGKGRALGVVLEPGRPFFFAVRAGKITGMSLALDTPRVIPGGALRARIQATGSATPGLRVFRFRVIGPDKRPRAIVDKLVPAPSGRALVEGRLPKDAPAGRYSVSARCVFSAAMAADSLTVGK